MPAPPSRALQKRVKADPSILRKLKAPAGLAAAAGRNLLPVPGIKKLMKELREVREVGAGLEAFEEEEEEEEEEEGEEGEDGEEGDEEEDAAEPTPRKSRATPAAKTPKRKPKAAESDDDSSVDSNLEARHPTVRRTADLGRLLHAAGAKRPHEDLLEGAPSKKVARTTTTGHDESD